MVGAPPGRTTTANPFGGELRDELLDREVFYSLLEAAVLIERRRRLYNAIRLPRALVYRPPAPEVVLSRPTEPA